MEENFMKRIIVNPKVMVGKPVIRGTRITVEAIIGRVAEGMTFDEILEDFPYITKEDIQAAIRYAESLVAGEEIIFLQDHTCNSSFLNQDLKNYYL